MREGDMVAMIGHQESNINAFAAAALMMMLACLLSDLPFLESVNTIL